MKILSVVGARPQFIKAAPVGRALADAGIDEVLLHTGQHYDAGMSAVFFRELLLEEPRYNLAAGSGSHGSQTAAMLVGIEQALIAEQPDGLLIYGDTNSTLAGVLAAAKLGVPVAHVEAGLRSYNRRMPEEINRVVADSLSNLLFCPTEESRANLAAEGVLSGVHVVGDVMYDALLLFSGIATAAPDMLERTGIRQGEYLLVTLHRASNTDNPENLRAILSALGRCAERVVLPLHPRTRNAIAASGLVPANNIMILEPVSYLEMLALERGARKILTDSGGVQKEAFWLAVPCITMRDETEWVETVRCGWNTLTGTDPDRILAAIGAPTPQDAPPPVYGDGGAAQRIAYLLRLVWGGRE